MKRLFGGKSAGPGWATPMDAREADELVEAVRADLLRRGLAATVADGLVTVEVEGEGEDQRFGLSNLAQLCHLLPASQWAETIAGHFDSLLAAQATQVELESMATDFERVRDLLKVRIYGDERIGGVAPEPPASWHLADGLTAVFVYDLPATVASVPAGHVRSWPLSHEELLAVALENVRREPVTQQPMDGSGPSAPQAIVGDHFFVASHAWLIPDKLPADARDGAVFAVPHRHALLFAPIVDIGIVDAINRLIVTGVSLYQQGPGSISPGLYWWRAGTISMLPSSFDGRNVTFAPPEAFVAVLNRLTGEDAGAT
jgi:hypothetical protein